MNKLLIKERSDYGVYLEVYQLEPLTGTDHGPVVIRTDGYTQGPTVVMSRAQAAELRDWLNAFLARTS